MIRGGGKWRCVLHKGAEHFDPRNAIPGQPAGLMRHQGGSVSG
jgi:hypothetical protein